MRYDRRFAHVNCPCVSVEPSVLCTCIYTPCTLYMPKRLCRAASFAVDFLSPEHHESGIKIAEIESASSSSSSSVYITKW